MTKVLLLLLALSCAGTAFAAADPSVSGAHSGAPELRQQDDGRTQLASLLPVPEVADGTEAAVDQDADEVAEQSADNYDLKLPEEDLPDSDIPLTFNSKVAYFTKYFQTSGRGAFAR